MTAATTAQTSAGYTLSIGTTATSPSGDSFSLIGLITNVPAFGKEYQEVTFNPVASRETQKFKGAYNSGSITLDLGWAHGDEGQLDVYTALDSDSLYNFRLEFNDKGTGSHGTYLIFKARVMSFTVNPGQVSNVVTGQIKLGIQGAITITDAA